MFYKPKFCCECGEKVERVNWKPWTSRQFCENCETENKFQYLLPRVGFVLAVLLGLWGIGSQISSSSGNEKPLQVTTEQKFASRDSSAQNQKAPPTQDSKTQSNAAAVNTGNDALPPQAKNQTPVSDPKQPEKLRLQTGKNPVAAKQTAVSEAVYFCGAQTKKGTPCSRRVKGGGRCWQHAGQPAILPPEKLLISQ